MAFKMSQVFPTASLDITEDFHILHNVYLYICYSILKAKTYNRLPNTHKPATCTNNKQLGTSHRLLMAIWLRCFFCVWNSDYFEWWKKGKKKEKKKEKICWHYWTGFGDACRLWSNEGMFQAFVFVWQRHKMDAFTKLGEPTIRAACTIFFYIFFINQYLSTFVMGSLYPQQMHAYYALHWVQSPGFPKIIY